MKTAYISVIIRYLAIAIQFAVVIAVTQKMPLAIAGQYFTIFGVIAVTFTLSGFGLPDGCVKRMSEARAYGDVSRLKILVMGAIPASLAVNLSLAPLIGVVAAKFTHLELNAAPVIAMWWFGYAGTFLGAQILIGFGRPVSATFFAYSSINLAYLVTVLPALMFLKAPELLTVMKISALATNGSMAVSMIFALRNSRELRQEVRFVEINQSFFELRSSASEGFPMMLSRFMQASLPWIPVWMLGALHSSEQAAIYAAASRLTVAVTSVVAALRFSMRATLVKMNAAKRYQEIAALNNKISLISAFPPVAGLVFLLFWGHDLVPWLLGAEYAPVVPVLGILMFGVLGEAFGGLSDEILKMTGAAKIVLWSLLGAMLCQVAAGLLLASSGPACLAWGTAVAFGLQYVWQTLWLSRRTSIAILPFAVPSRKGR